jgi:general secretion pathway protein D
MPNIGVADRITGRQGGVAANPIFIYCKALVLVSSLLLAGTSLQAQSQSESVLQKETIRRQELVLRAVKQLDDAERLIQLGKDPEARVIIKEILEQIPDAGEGRSVYVRASSMISRLDANEGIKALEAKKYFDARNLALSALKYNKGNAQAQKVLLTSNEILGIKEDGKPQSPAVDPKFVGNLNKIDNNIERARDFMVTGNYELAEKELEQALALDPYHKVAAEMQLKLYKKMGRSKEIAAKSSRQERLTETRNGWSEVYQVENNLENKASAVVPIAGKANFLVSQKLQSLVIKNVDFTDATIDDAVSFLTAKSREMDSTGSGISFIVKNEKARTEAKPFSLRLRNVPVGEVLRYICNIAGVKYKVEEFAIFIVPLSDGDDAVMVTREFPVKETFFDTSNTTSSEAAPAGAANARRPRANVTSTTVKSDDPVRKSLQERGVEFPEGSAAIYNRATGILTIKNTQDQVDLVEELVTVDQGETLLVKVETKLVEINQTDLDSLAFNYNLAGAYPVNGGSTKLAGGNIQSGTALQGSNGLSTADRVQTFLDGTSATQPQNSLSVPNRFGVSGAIDGNRFQALMEALSQKTSTDLVTAPSVVVNDGQSANVLVAREFYYPTEFDQAAASSAIVANRSLAANGYTISPSFPTEFKSRNVGVSIIVQPRITVDRQRVFLTLKPEVTEFDGFINYGSQIFDPNVPGQLLSANTVNQPVFSTKAVENAQLEIQDGYTMVLGGLIREDISTVNDKVPILGDIPIVGRLFRSKAEQAIKKNLLIFVSVRILRPDGEPFNVGSTKVAAAAAR